MIPQSKMDGNPSGRQWGQQFHELDIIALLTIGQSQVTINQNRLWSNRFRQNLGDHFREIVGHVQLMIGFGGVGCDVRIGYKSDPRLSRVCPGDGCWCEST